MELREALDVLLRPWSVDDDRDTWSLAGPVVEVAARKAASGMMRAQPMRVLFDGEGRRAIAEVVVRTIDRMFAPAPNPREHGRLRLAPVAVLLGPRLRELSYVGHWGIAAHWHDLPDQSLRAIVAYSLSCLRESEGRLMKLDASLFRQYLGFALAEARYRGILPTPADLHVAWDLAESRGLVRPADLADLTLADIWARFVPLIEAGSPPPPHARPCPSGDLLYLA